MHFILQPGGAARNKIVFMAVSFHVRIWSRTKKLPDVVEFKSCNKMDELKYITLNGSRMAL